MAAGLLKLHEPSGNTRFFVSSWIEQISDRLDDYKGCRILVSGNWFTVQEEKLEVAAMLEKLL